MNYKGMKGGDTPLEKVRRVRKWKADVAVKI